MALRGHDNKSLLLLTKIDAILTVKNKLLALNAVQKMSLMAGKHVKLRHLVKLTTNFEQKTNLRHLHISFGSIRQAYLAAQTKQTQLLAKRLANFEKRVPEIIPVLTMLIVSVVPPPPLATPY